MYYIKKKELIREILEKLKLNVDLSGDFKDIIPQLSIEQWVLVLNLVEDEKIRSEWAYNVGIYMPKEKQNVIDFVTDSEFAFYWAKDIGDRDVMVHRIVDYHYGILWAQEFGDHYTILNQVLEHIFLKSYRNIDLVIVFILFLFGCVYLYIYTSSFSTLFFSLGILWLFLLLVYGFLYVLFKGWIIPILKIIVKLMIMAILHLIFICAGILLLSPCAILLGFLYILITK